MCLAQLEINDDLLVVRLVHPVVNSAAEESYNVVTLDESVSVTSPRTPLFSLCYLPALLTHRSYGGHARR